MCMCVCAVDPVRFTLKSILLQLVVAGLQFLTAGVAAQTGGVFEADLCVIAN